MELQPIPIIPSAVETLVEQLPGAIASAASSLSSDSKLVIVLDGLDQLDSETPLDFLQGDTEQKLSWFPSSLPSNVRVIFATRPGDALTSLKLRNPQSVSPADLNDKDRAAITRHLVAKASQQRKAIVLSDAKVCILIVCVHG